MQNTGPQNVSSLVRDMRAYHASLDASDLTWRKEQLQALEKMLRENEVRFMRALKEDLGTNPTDGALLQLGVVSGEIRDALKHLDKWAKPRRVITPLPLQPSSAKVVPEPLGVALIVGAWNYPLLLTLSPLVACIAAGNAAVIKPSEMAPATSSLIAELLPHYLDPKAFSVIEGGVPETTAILKERFDTIFFTGSSRVGQIVMEAAAKHVTPVTLELGGQCPAVIDKSANLRLAALRLTFAKFSNAGQTCVAPNHIFVHKDVAEAFTAELKKTIRQFYGDDPQKSPDFGRIVSRQHHQRLTDLLKDQEIAVGGQSDINDRYIAPTVLTNVSPDAPVMKEEIFGPILPVIPVDNVSDAFNKIAQGPAPLAAYVFAEDESVIHAAEKIKAGAVDINTAMVHLGVHGLPFGGVGASGFGQYHGKAGFDLFSHNKPILKGGRLETGVHLPPHRNPLKRAVLKLLHLT